MTPSQAGLLVVLAGTIAVAGAVAEEIPGEIPEPPSPPPRLEGWVTTYGCPGEEYFHGAPLYCDDGVMDLTYREDLPWWGAVDVSEYLNGRVECGDRLLACTDKGCVVIRAWDAGHLYYNRRTGKPWKRLGGRHVVLDLPYHVTTRLGWTGLDKVTVVNLDGMERSSGKWISRYRSNGRYRLLGRTRDNRPR